MRVLLLLAMNDDSPPLVSGALRLIFRHFSQRQEVVQAFQQVQLLVSDSDVETYKQIKRDLDRLRLLVEKSELWVFHKKKNSIINATEGGERGGDPVLNSTLTELNCNDKQGLETIGLNSTAALLDNSPANNYNQIKHILIRMKELCLEPVFLSTNPSVNQLIPRKHEQRLLRNMVGTLFGRFYFNKCIFFLHRESIK